VDRLAEGITACHNAARHERRSPARWRWLCVDNPGEGGASVVAMRDGDVAGFLGNTYMRFSLAGRRIRAGFVGDLSILEPERSWGCYAGLVEESARKAVADGVELGYAFALRSAAEVSRRLGAACLGRLPVYAGFLSVPRMLKGRGASAVLSRLGGLAQPLVGLKRAGAAADDLDIRPIEGPFDAAFDELWNAVEAGRTVTVVRDAAYLNWRYVDCPATDYARLAAFRDGSLQGLAVFCAWPERRKAYLVELLARDDCPATLAALLGGVVESLAAAGIGLVTACFPAGSAEAQALRRMGFRGWVGRFWNLELTVMTDPDGGGPELDVANWYFSLGDWLTH